MTKKQAKIFAKIYAGTIVGYADGFMFMDNRGNMDLVPETDQEKMLDACIDISNKILGDFDEMSEPIEIYKYVIKNF